MSDHIVSKPSTPAYRVEYDRIFGREVPVPRPHQDETRTAFLRRATARGAAFDDAKRAWLERKRHK